MSSEAGIRSRVTLTYGAGQPQDISEDEALAESGTTQDVLARLASGISDPVRRSELLRVLENERLVVEIDGDGRERSVSPNARWEDVVPQELREGHALNIRTTVSHKGGRAVVVR
jgi:hypothetical protein